MAFNTIYIYIYVCVSVSVSVFVCGSVATVADRRSCVAVGTAKSCSSGFVNGEVMWQCCCTAKCVSVRACCVLKVLCSSWFNGQPKGMPNHSLGASCYFDIPICWSYPELASVWTFLFACIFRVWFKVQRIELFLGKSGFFSFSFEVGNTGNMS